MNFSKIFKRFTLTNLISFSFFMLVYIQIVDAHLAIKLSTLQAFTFSAIWVFLSSQKSISHSFIRKDLFLQQLVLEMALLGYDVSQRHNDFIKFEFIKNTGFFTSYIEVVVSPDHAEIKGPKYYLSKLQKNLST